MTPDAIPPRRASTSGLVGVLGLGAMLLALAASAQAPRLSVVIGDLGLLAPGRHAEVIVEVHAEEAARGPLLVTPSVDGAAILHE